MRRYLVLVFLFILLSSHELFLKTDSHFLSPDSEEELYLFNGTFDKSENVITRDRILEAVVLGSDYEFLPGPNDYYDKGDATYLKLRTGDQGTYVAGISTQSRVLEMNAEDFQEYLEHEELTDMIEMRKRNGLDKSPARERYSKHVKAILQVGGKLSDEYSTELGYPIEFIPQINPYYLKSGDDITFQLLRDGAPLANQVVHYRSSKDAEERSKRTDKEGVIRFNLTNPGKWYVATIHLTESDEESVDYESNWATLTFEVRE